MSIPTYPVWNFFLFSRWFWLTAEIVYPPTTYSRRVHPKNRRNRRARGGGGAISWESRCNIEMNVWAHFYNIWYQPWVKLKLPKVGIIYEKTDWLGLEGMQAKTSKCPGFPLAPFRFLEPPTALSLLQNYRSEQNVICLGISFWSASNRFKIENLMRQEIEFLRRSFEFASSEKVTRK